MLRLAYKLGASAAWTDTKLPENTHTNSYSMLSFLKSFEIWWNESTKLQRSMPNTESDSVTKLEMVKQSAPKSKDLIFGNPRKRGFNQESHLWIVRRMIEEEENDSSKCWILPLPSFIFSPLQLYIAITPFAIPIQIRGGSGSHGGSKGKGRSRIAWA